ncbi:MAG: hypothetical protein NTW65_09275 [Deltaproteobacteria bacterium]|nr:hypothetical protein [Deltaproteobacteria bacterium]
MDSTKTGRALPQPDVTIQSAVLLDNYFNSVRKIFAHALESGGKPVKKYFTLCDSTIELIFPDDKLLPYITPALEHLSITSAESPALTIRIWDDVTTNTMMPTPPWLGYAVQAKGGNIEGVYTNRGDIRGFGNSRIKTAFNWSANALSMYDSKEKIGYYWTKDARELPAYETSAPVRTILNWWVQERNFHFAHGAAVGTKRGGVLIAGKGGSGKSTAALASLNSGLLYVSDDYCVVSAQPVPAAYSVFSSAKVDPGNIFRVEHIAPTRVKTGNKHDDKEVFFLYPRFSEQITSWFPLRAILLPRITGKPDSALIPATPADCIKALTLSTMCQFPGAGKKAVDIFVRLAKTLPGYYLDFGTDVAQVPKLISDLLEKRDMV